jgi:hypothetical protein
MDGVAFNNAGSSVNKTTKVPWLEQLRCYTF